MANTLPDRPNLDWLKKAAKERPTALREREPSARLHEAQLEIARDYGFASWRALKAHVDVLSVDGQVIAATLAGEARELERLLAAHPRKLALTGGPWNAPLLHLAAERGHLEVGKRLLAAGAEAPMPRANRFERLVPVLRVGSLAASLDYYVDKLGFRKFFEWGNPATFASVSRNDVEIFLSQEEWMGPTSLSVFVQDVDALYDDYQASGALIRRPPFDFPWGVRGMDVEDIDGHHLRFSGDGAQQNRSP